MTLDSLVEPPVDPHDSVVFLDETGDERFSDATHQVFGLGGCAIRASLYDAVVREPWEEMKTHAFHDHRGRMHASEMKPNQIQVEALAAYFRQQEFLRIAAMVTPESRHSNATERLAECCVFISAALQSFAQDGRASRLFFVIEDSHRRPAHVSWYLRQQIMIQSGKGRNAVPVVVGTMDKLLGEAGLEVADFVMHAAGGQMRRGLSPTVEHRKDFATVFTDARQSLVRFTFVR